MLFGNTISLHISSITVGILYTIHGATALYAILNMFYLLYPVTRIAFSLKRHEMIVVCIIFSLFCTLPLILPRFRTTILKVNLAVLGASALLLVIIGSTDLSVALAHPLIICDPLSNADVIVILGGGSISAKLSYAAALHKGGYAPELVFLGGGGRYYLEHIGCENGIDPQKITFISGHDTHQEALTARQILRERRWEKVILVSGPTHMFRAGKSFAKQGISILHAPVPDHIWYRTLHTELIPRSLRPPNINSSPFTRRRHIRHFRFRELLHEYVGIIYYYLRGHL